MIRKWGHFRLLSNINQKFWLSRSKSDKKSFVRIPPSKCFWFFLENKIFQHGPGAFWINIIKYGTLALDKKYLWEPTFPLKHYRLFFKEFIDGPDGSNGPVDGPVSHNRDKYRTVDAKRLFERDRWFSSGLGSAYLAKLEYIMYSWPNFKARF